MKKLLFFFAALALAMPTIAQTDDDEDEGVIVKVKQNAFYVGPKVGVSLNTMTQPTEGDLYDAAGVGFSAGVAFKARFGQASTAAAAGTGHWGLGAELKYRYSSVKTKAIDEDGSKDADLSLGYFDVPVYAQFYPFVKSASFNSFYIELGASFGGTIYRSPKSLTLGAADTKSEYGSVEYDINKDGSKLKGFDVRPLAGVGYTIPNTGLDINLRYYLGVQKLAGNFKSKISSAELSVAWNFCIGKL